VLKQLWGRSLHLQTVYHRPWPRSNCQENPYHPPSLAELKKLVAWVELGKE